MAKIRSRGETHGRYTFGVYSVHKPEGNSYRAMKNRCLSPNYRYFHRYGGRGIKICERWLGVDGFKNFLADLGKKPTPKHSLDRIDNDGDYTPENCRWATQTMQIYNSSRQARTITVNGETLTYAEWAKRCGVALITIHARLKYGWSELEAVTTPPFKPGTSRYT